MSSPPDSDDDLIIDLPADLPAVAPVADSPAPPPAARPAAGDSDSQTGSLTPDPALGPSPVPAAAPARPEDRITSNGTRVGRRHEQAKSVAKLAGIKKGTELPTKRTLVHVQERAVEAFATSILESGQVAIKPASRLGPPSEEDRRAVSRLMGMPAEDFQARIAAKLEALADKVSQRMEQKLDADLYRPQELNMALAITLDKHAAVSGRNALKGASVNIQVNNFGDSADKDSLIREIRGAMDVAVSVQPE